MKFQPRNRVRMLSAIGVVAAGITLYFAFLRGQTLLNALDGLMDILFPFVVGGSIAYILTPVCKTYERGLARLFAHLTRSKKNALEKARPIACILTLITLFIGVAIFLWLLIPQLYESIAGLFRSIPAYSIEVYRRLQPMLQRFGMEQNLNPAEWTTAARSYLEQLFNGAVLGGIADIAASLTKSVTAAAGIIVDLLVSVIVSFYCLNSRRTFLLQGRKLIFAAFPRAWAEEILYWLRFTNRAFSGFVSGRILDSAIIGVICFVGCSLLHITYAPLIAVVVGVTNVIPFFGPFIGGIPSAILVLLENPLQALYFVIFVILLQQFDGNILGPHILSSAVGISSFWVLFSILLFGGWLGVVGMILGIPIFAVVYAIVREWTNRRLSRRGLPLEAYKYDPDLSTQFTLDQNGSEPSASNQTGSGPSDDSHSAD